MLSGSVSPQNSAVRGWLFDVYPSNQGEVAVWVIGQNGDRIRFTDKFQPKVYISGKEEAIELLANTFHSNSAVAWWGFALKYAHATAAKKTKVLEVTLKDCRRTSSFTLDILRAGDYLKYEIHNSDLRGDRAYLFAKNVFPLAYVNVEPKGDCLQYRLLDSVRSRSYKTPPFRVMELSLDIRKAGKIANFDDPIGEIAVSQEDQKTILDSGGDDDKLLHLVKAVKELDPDIIITSGGDSYLFPYLIHRAQKSEILEQFILGRDSTPFGSKTVGSGKTFFSYGRTFYRANTVRLFGRVHIDARNTFALNESGFEGLFEIARICRMPLHSSSRASIGSSMTSMQVYQAIKDNVLIPRNKSIPEAFKSGYELLVGDRGGVVYDPRIGIHDDVGEVDFSSMYPALMVNNNISAETVLCKCCQDSSMRIPELNYSICEKRVGIVPKTLRFIVEKRQIYKRLRDETNDPKMKEIYDHRQGALKWILVTCFGYLGYRNAKFGTVDGHIGVCAFGREAFLKASRMAEKRNFTVVHGIVDSLWLKKTGGKSEDYLDLCREVSSEVGVPLNFEGRYKWIVFLPSKVHPRVGVVNRYYGVMESGKVKVRGIDVRRHDTPKFIYDAQMEMIKVLATANNSREFTLKIPEALKVIKTYRQRLLSGDVPIWDLVVTKHLSKEPAKYRQQVSQVIAAKQLITEGSQVQAGQNVNFIFTDATSKRVDRRVRAQQLIEKGTNPDLKQYLLLLYASAANILGFAGYTPQVIFDEIRGYGNKRLTDYLFTSDD